MRPVSARSFARHWNPLPVYGSGRPAAGGAPLPRAKCAPTCAKRRGRPLHGRCHVSSWRCAAGPSAGGTGLRLLGGNAPLPLRPRGPLTLTCAAKACFSLFFLLFGIRFRFGQMGGAPVGHGEELAQLASPARPAPAGVGGWFRPSMPPSRPRAGRGVPASRVIACGAACAGGRVFRGGAVCAPDCPRARARDSGPGRGRTFPVRSRRGFAAPSQCFPAQKSGKAAPGAAFLYAHSIPFFSMSLLQNRWTDVILALD